MANVDISGHIEVLQAKGLYYFLYDTELRKQVEKWSEASELSPTSTDPISSKVVYEAIQEAVSNLNSSIDLKLDVSVYQALLSNLAAIAFSGSYNDLTDIPSITGARVEGSTLIFSGSSSGREAELEEQLDLTAEVIGNGVL